MSEQAVPINRHTGWLFVRSIKYFLRSEVRGSGGDSAGRPTDGEPVEACGDKRS